MEEKLISKKEILNATGISYGQFYRWKRKGLIPDKWLIHQSTRTGQESFLPEDKILPRIEKIKELKEDNTLKEIADLLSPELVEKKYVRSSLQDLDWVDEKLLEAYEEITDAKELYSFRDLVFLMVLFKLKESGGAARNAYLALEALTSSETERNEFDEKIVIARRCSKLRPTEPDSDDSYGFCAITASEVRFDPSVEVLEELNLSELVRELKLELRENGVLGREG
jgi:DNA-binding transcriptional MerR regulator